MVGDVSELWWLVLLSILLLMGRGEEVDFDKERGGSGSSDLVVAWFSV